MGPTRARDGALSYSSMTSYDYTSFRSKTDHCSYFTYPQVVYENLIYIVVLHMHDVLLRTSDGKWLSYKNTTREIIDLHLFSGEHLPAVRPGDVDPRGAITAVCPFYGGSKPRTGTAICFCPLLDFIYSRSLAVKLGIYDLLFN